MSVKACNRSRIMITIEKLKVYKNYDGDIDSWARSARKHEKAAIDNREWYLIDRLIQDLKLIDKGLAADSYANEVNIRLSDNCDKETIELIRALAAENKGSRKNGILDMISNWFRRK